MDRSQRTGLQEELGASFGPDRDWRPLLNLLAAGDYQRAAARLTQKLTEIDDDVLARNLAAVRQLCLACHEYDLEKELHQTALTNAAEREDALRQQILAIVALLGASDTTTSLVRTDSAASKATSSGERERPTVWQQLRKRLASAYTRLRALVSTLASWESGPEPPHEGQRANPVTRGQTRSAEPAASVQTPSQRAHSVTQNVRTRVQEKATYQSYRTNTWIQRRGVGGEPQAKREKGPGEHAVLGRYRVRRGERRLSDLKGEHSVTQGARRLRGPSARAVKRQRDPFAGAEIIPPPASQKTARTALAPVEQTEADRHSLAVYCLGSFAVYQNDNPITAWNGLKGLSILKYMIAQRGKPVAKEVLMEVGWPESDPEGARRNLHQAIYSLRQTLRHDEPDFQHIQFHNDSYRFNPKLNVWIDFVEFETHVAAGHGLEATGHLEQALRSYGIAGQLYRGDFFEGDLYEEWAVGKRERLRNLYLQVADRLIEHTVDREAYTVAATLCQTVLEREPYHETAHRHLMECYMAQGQRHLAVRQYQLCARLLADELNLEPSEESKSLYKEITFSRESKTQYQAEEELSEQ
jgi:DNA-binding SARP family transcriptional activator